MKRPYPPVDPPPSAPTPIMPPRRPRRDSILAIDGEPAWSKLEMFRGLEPVVVDELRQAMTVVMFSPGQTIIKQGDVGDDMFLLDSGSVKISVRDSRKKTVFERVLTGPAMFGETALLTNEPRTATVLAETAARCLRIDRDGFDALVDRNSQVSVFLTKMVGERLMEAGTIQKVGKYEVMGRLGQGAVATVFVALHPELGQEVALKMLSHALVYHEGFAEQFREEARLVASLQHEHIVRVLDTAQAYGTHFIVMERLTGTLLEDLIDTGPRLAWGAIRRILKEVCWALDYSHGRGLLHRDIKPSNVFLTEDRRVKILDFGIAVREEASAESGGHLLGTPYYMSPEQILGRKLDGRSDLYATGVLAYELCTRHVPFDADSLDDLLRQHLNAAMPDPRDIEPEVPEDLVEFILKCTAKTPKERYANARVAAEFLQAAGELPLVHRFELSTLAISYHPSKRAQVNAALRRLQREIGDRPGISLVFGHTAAKGDAGT